MILPSMAQLDEDVTFEVGTTDVIPARVEAVKFCRNGDVTYDLLVPGPTGGQPVSVIGDVHSSLVSVTKGKDPSLLPMFEQLLRPVRPE